MTKEKRKELVADLKESGVKVKPMTSFKVGVQQTKTFSKDIIGPQKFTKGESRQARANVRLVNQPIGRQAQFEMSAAQKMLSEVVGGGERNWGTGQNLPKMNGALTNGGGLIKNGDIYRETGGMFGLR